VLIWERLNVAEFRLFEQPASLSELTRCAALRNLQHRQLRLELNTMEFLDDPLVGFRSVATNHHLE
jgi:hypothetical protein